MFRLEEAMDWIPNLLKQISVSLQIAFGLFCAGAFLLFASYLKAGLFDPLSGLHRVLVWAVFIYASSILIYSLSQFFWKGVCLLFDKAGKAWRGRTISDREASFLEWAAHKGCQPVNMHVEMSGTKGLDQHRFLRIMESLHGKGFIEISPYDRTIFTLTNKGREKVLALPSVCKNDS